MKSRDEIYIQILHFGLLSLRDASFREDLDYWKIESEHLHNIPSLIGENNQLRHDYYFEKERTRYLESITAGQFDVDFTLARYRELWAELESHDSA